MQDPSPRCRCNITLHPKEWKTPDPDLLQAASQSPPQQHYARGPRRILHWTPPLSRCLEETPRTGGLVTPATILHAPDGSVSYVVVGVVSKNTPHPKTSIKQPRSRRRSTSPRCFTLAPSHRSHSSKPRESLAPSSDVVPHRVALAKLSNPPQSAASLVVPRCHCRKRHPLT
jgi:hypothetical protein